MLCCECCLGSLALSGYHAPLLAVQRGSSPEMLAAWQLFSHSQLPAVSSQATLRCMKVAHRAAIIAHCSSWYGYNLSVP